MEKEIRRDRGKEGEIEERIKGEIQNKKWVSNLVNLFNSLGAQEYVILLKSVLQ